MTVMSNVSNQYAPIGKVLISISYNDIPTIDDTTLAENMKTELKKWYESIKIDNKIPDVKVTDGRITHFEPGVYVSDVKNYNK